MDHMYKEVFTWSKDALYQLQNPYGTLDSVNLQYLNRLTKPELENVCVRALHFVLFLLKNVSALRNSSSSLQSTVIECQQQVISAQAELSDCKTGEFETLKQAMETSVVYSVKVEIQSHSAAVHKSLLSC